MIRTFFLVLGLGIPLLLGIAVVGLFTTETGLHVAWRIAVPLLHSLADIDMQAERIGGRLLGPVTVTGFSYRDPWVLVEVDQGEIHWQPRQLLRARVHIDEVAAHEVRVQLQPATGEDEASGDPDPLPVTVHVQKAVVHSVRFQLDPDSDVWQFSEANAHVKVLEDRVVVEQLTTQAYGIAGLAQGFIGWHGRFPLALDAAFNQTLPSGETLRSQIRATGDLEAFKLQLATEPPYSSDLSMTWKQGEQGYAIHLTGPVEPAPLLVALGQLPPEALATGPVDVQAQGLLTTHGFEASQLQLGHSDTSINASGQLSWHSGKLAWTSTASWQNLHLPPWAPALTSVEGNTRIQGGIDEGEVMVDAAYAVETQQPGRVQLVGRWQGDTVQLERGELAVGRSRLTGQGSIWPRAGFHWTVDSPSLAELWPEARGHLKGQGAVSGDWLAPRINVDLKGSKVQLAAIGLDRLDLQANLDLEQDSQGSMQLAIAGLRVPDIEPTNLQLSIKGRRSDHRLVASLHSRQLSGNVEAKGGWAGGKSPWLGQLQILGLKPAATSRWELQAPAQLQIHAEHISLAQTCLRQGGSLLCLKGQSQGQGLAAQWQGEAQLTQLPLALFSPWMPASLQLQGNANAQTRISGTGGQWQTFNLSSDARARLSREAVDETLRLDLQDLTIAANPEQWQGKLGLHINDTGRVDAEAIAKPRPPSWQDAGLRGSLRVDIPNLQTIALIAPEIEQLKGHLAGEIQASGSLGKPLFGGRMALDKGRLELRDYGIALSPLTASITAAPNGLLDLNMQAVSGGGELRAQGQIKPDFKQPALNMTVKGQRFLASRTDEATLYVSPDLKLSLLGQQLELTGQLDIPEALLQPGTQRSSVQGVSADQVMVTDQQVAAREPRWKLLARIRLILGDKVRFSGLGIETRLTGQLDIRENPGRPTTANGEIRLIDGAYEVYGQKLDIDTGRLIFANAPVTEPALDLQASRVPRPQIKVGVKVRGLLDAPTVTLFSNPSMRQAEQLSYLILGRPLEGNEGNPTLASAALALGLKRGDKYIKGLSETFNVDEIGIETTPGQSAEQASLVVGKYLSPRLYVSYGAGLFETLHKLRMRYRLSERWTLVGESGTTQGADILYTIER